jgi:Protein of unknown function (DUF3887)
MGEIVRLNIVALVGAGALAVTPVGATACQDNITRTSPASSATSTLAAPSPAGPAPSSAAPGRDDQLALQILDAVVREDFVAATTAFDATMKQQLSPSGLGSAWTTYQLEFGKYQSHGNPQDVLLGELTVVNVPLQMQNMLGEFRVTFHPDATVAGLYFLKTGVPVS